MQKFSEEIHNVQLYKEIANERQHGIVVRAWPLESDQGSKHSNGS